MRSATLSLLIIASCLHAQIAQAVRPCQSQKANDALGAMAQDTAKDWATERFKGRKIVFETQQGSINFALMRQRMPDKRFDCAVTSRTFNLGDSVLRMNVECAFEQALPVVYSYALKVCEEKEAMRVTQSVRRGRPLSGDWLMPGRMNVPVASVPVTHIALQDRQWQVNRFVEAGDVLDDRMIESVPVVIKGRETMVNVSTGTASITFPVKATHDARVGERIKVRTQSGAIVEGTVLARDFIGINGE